MKSLICFFFITSLLNTNLNAQHSQFSYLNPGDLPFNITVSTRSGEMKIELSKINQIDSLGDMDSLLANVWKSLSPIKDSLHRTNSSVRVDLSAGKNPWINLRHTAVDEFAYTYGPDGNFRQVKLGYDTLRIRLSTAGKWAKSFNGEKYLMRDYYFVTLLTKDITRTASFSPGMLDSAVNIVRNNLRDKQNMKAAEKRYAYFDMMNNKWMGSPRNWKKDNSLTFEPDLYANLQYVRGEWVPSIDLGFQLIVGNYFKERKIFKLMWEPHFFFSKNVKGTLQTDRNDFIVFRYTNYTKKYDKEIFVPEGFSVGYLIGKKGDLYEKNTIKFSVYALHYEFISIEPEFFFNDLFKHFSPSLKLNFNID